MKKIEIGEHGSVNIKWRVLPMDYSHETEANIISAFSKKYGIPKERVKVEPVFLSAGDSGYENAFASYAVKNIQDPEFQQHLYQQYIESKNISCDFDKIVEIDNVMNAGIDYEVYDQNRKYTIKWIKWSNFMSYGPDNFIDLTTFKGLVLLSSVPANQGGKTTFCLDLFRFLLFGKVTSRENNWTLAKVFNRHLPEATEVSVEGCISFDGVDYVIKRVVSRPSAKRRTEKSTVSQKVSYYKIVNGEYIDLEDDGDNETGANGRETNKIIKEAIGNERDFDLMICVDSSNLKDLISLKDTDRGRLIARWIGLLPLEEKDKMAREYFNKNITPKLLMTKYNKEDLASENEEIAESIAELTKNGVKWSKELETVEKEIKEYNERRDIYLKSIIPIDEDIEGLDKQTIEQRRKKYIDDGLKKKDELEANKEAYENVKGVKFSEEDYKGLVNEDKALSIKISKLESENSRLENEIKQLEKGEFCPTCGARLKDVDNSAAIAEKKQKMSDNEKDGAKLEAKAEEISDAIAGMEEDRKKYNEKNRLSLLIDKNEVDLDNLRGKVKECNGILKDLEKNDAAIRKNNETNASINLINASIKEKEKVRDELKDSIEEARADIKADKKKAAENKGIIEVIEKEEELVRNWKIYLEMVGKNGITKMVLRESLPLINGELHRLLTDVCDFDVEIAIDERNDVAFYLIHDGVRSNLGSGSGFEQTVASLALRSVLSKISTFSKPSFVVFDEILGGVADENYDQMKLLYDKIVKDYAFIMQISHLKAIADWHNTQIVVKKENNISTIEVA